MRLRTVLAAGVGLAAVAQLLYPVLPGPAGFALSDLIVASASGYAAWHYWRRSRRRGDSRSIRVGYAFGACSCTTWSLANLLMLIGVLAFPVLDRLGVLLSMIAAAMLPVAVVLAGPRLRGIASARRAIDVAAVSGAVFVLAWEYVLSDEAGLPGDRLVTTTIVAVLVVGSAVALVTLSESSPRGGLTAQQFLAGAALLQSATVLISLHNSVTGHAWYGNGAGAGYVLSAWVVAVSSRLRISRPGGDLVERLVFGPWALLPYVPVVIAVGIAAVREAQDGRLSPILVWLLLSSFSLVLLRQFLTLVTVGRMTVILEEQKLALDHQAHHDGLTGLPNRVAFHSRAAEVLARQRTGVCAMMLDLDGFKPVNDTFGHAAGDEVLIIVGRRLAAELRESDLLSRFGGDEFAILVTELSEADAAAVAQRLLDRLAEPMTVHDAVVRVGGSIGLAALPPGRSGSVSALLRQADTAMYAAKASGKGAIRWHQPDTWPASA
ncbi:GGDEF domain-containing protein [Actinoplanes regularis]|uniref:Diguanylate cyclase (GGDEF) domain-containing protein n=1 Tax=Actinoplanes regularis TaxID=52697 RepID=A0A239A7W8_9ACTN|nr:GGDEF domain-containing protein [Actinoplanes regularis]SNR91707.1 diguanylate cyclase (GGDEF) domain-containing protein [Actinoplanes regularis]